MPANKNTKIIHNNDGIDIFTFPAQEDNKDNIVTKIYYLAQKCNIFALWLGDEPAGSPIIFAGAYVLIGRSIIDY